jgi:hypothetical protein
VDDSDIKSKKGNKYHLPDIIENRINSKIIEDSYNEHYDDNSITNNHHILHNNIVSNNNKSIIIKLPQINKKGVNADLFKKSGSNNFGDYKVMKHNLSNHSIENTINNTQYSKNMMIKNKIPFKKDQFKEIKKNYISPYAQKIINNNLKIL